MEDEGKDREMPGVKEEWVRRKGTKEGIERRRQQVKERTGRGKRKG